ncbi:nucleotidyltransferase domain-containing protein [Actinoplanes oblitus]|uniref:Nucleotidyltransferase domain-containing protein n=1 Tax=Actinoplanes oblitus TaxID=3040509 RepID=A0ABY8WB00_9ACTN|nr:nucleotidyltransferase domain-containing protein [Actinoplanes oblitus]WIM94547.1 nucleotidyltransferase domain-containing protein [Actinoplanes oblitus]
MDPVDVARELVLDRFPDAEWALLTGSVVGPHRTAGSDLDIVVLDETDPGHRESLHHRGWPVEFFVHTRARLAGFLASELAQRKPSTHRMLADGVVLLGDPGDLPARCARVLADGPAPLTAAEREWLRYGLTDGLDDLRHATDPGERVVIAATLWTGAAEAYLAAAGRWLSGGKWLLRNLREYDPAFAERWLASRDDPAAIAAEVLDGAGGPLFDGYRA